MPMALRDFFYFKTEAWNDDSGNANNKHKEPPGRLNIIDWFPALNSIRIHTLVNQVYTDCCCSARNYIGCGLKFSTNRFVKIF